MIVSGEWKEGRQRGALFCTVQFMQVLKLLIYLQSNFNGNKNYFKINE